MIMKNAKYYVRNLMAESEVLADAVSLVTPDGKRFELRYRVSDGKVSLSVDAELIVNPRAANLIYLDTK